MPIFEALLRVFQGITAVVALFSPGYRKKLLTRWSAQSRIVVLEECFGAALGLAMIIGIIIFTIRYA